MIDVKYPNGTTGDSKSNTVAGNSSIISTARDLYYDQLQEPSDGDWAIDSDPYKSFEQYAKMRDFVAVVRCKDCIYYGDHGDMGMECAMMILYPNKPTDYCSLGIRREDELLTTDKD